MIFGPVRSFVGTVRTNIFHFSENFEWTLYFFNFSKFWSVPRTGPTKIRTDKNPDRKSGPRTGPTNLGPKIRYGPAVHDYDKLSCATSGGAGVIMIGWKFSNQSWEALWIRDSDASSDVVGRYVFLIWSWNGSFSISLEKIIFRTQF